MVATYFFIGFIERDHYMNIHINDEIFNHFLPLINTSAN